MLTPVQGIHCTIFRTDGISGSLLPPLGLQPPPGLQPYLSLESPLGLEPHLGLLLPLGLDLPPLGLDEPRIFGMEKEKVNELELIEPYFV